MSVDAAMIEQMILEGIPDATVKVEDLRGDGEHYAAYVVSPSFAGKTRVQQHKMVFDAMKGKMGTSCTRWRCRPRCRSNFVLQRKGVRMMDNVVFDRIRKELKDNDVVLFMKGTAAYPQCGFSSVVVQVLSHLGIPFRDINVLEDNDIREGIKEFTDWPTIPQLYVKGEFIGGSDIVREMYATGELQELLAEKGC